MVRLTRETEYALRALSYLAGLPGGGTVPASRVAEACRLPREFLSKTLRRLVRSGLLRSSRGRSRGYGLARSPREISVREVLEAVEGPDYFRRCVFWDSRCSEDRPCVLHRVWADVRPQLVEALGQLTLDVLLEPWWARDPPELRLPFRLSESKTDELQGR
ncbi:MAG: Rrf2 family transcriptional regulator [Armatimonadota bacterium]|nr:Rrf2 family transcriptional regulator [Armatimonadota bacterium]MDR7440086.1 Rrf2 family transcriptional regulator [Armatimonadota bacterium]MDR7563574.1 Rrf2 family transcriptional regulator [Armatimonadota bacterium]MDR7568238.1 Rrf2 family transcriptional regulator [Armatimonadota bacterium]MDR7602186.1 Rrf2 family transcriptional regulator [Armatimonadota bacterium]